MIGYFFIALAMILVAAACAFVGKVADGARDLNDQGEAAWPTQDSSWR